MICDDDKSILDVCKLILHEDYRVETITNCESFIENIKTIKPHLLLMDIIMPGEGAKAAALIRHTPQTSHIPVILFSALSNIKDINQKARATAIIEKPFDLNFLTEAIRKYIL